MKINQIIKPEINGFRQKMHIWGTDPANPIILFLHGGPGNPNRHKIRQCLLPLTDSYTLCAYDQRGAGGSYKKMDPKDLHPSDFPFDIVEWAKFLTRRYHQKQIYLVGESWGSLIGTVALLIAPSLFKGYIGYGQVVDLKETLSIQYKMALKKAQELKRDDLLKKLTALGEPENGAFKDQNGESLFYQIFYRLMSKPGEKNYYVREIKPFLHSWEYSICDKINWDKGRYLIDASKPFWETTTPSLYNFNGFQLCFRMPYYILQGADDFITPYEQLPRYIKTLESPKKELVGIPGGGHVWPFDQPERFMEEVRKRFC